jgi:hypothetical protein
MSPIGYFENIVHGKSTQMYTYIHTYIRTYEHMYIHIYAGNIWVTIPVFTSLLL